MTRALVIAGLLILAPAAALFAAPASSPSPGVSPSPAPEAVPAGFGRLTAEKVRYDTKTRVVTATGSVTLQMGEMELQADRLRLEPNPRTAVAQGHVIVRQRDLRLDAPELRYDFGTEVADATGGVVLQQQQTTVKAPRIQFDLRNEITTATGGVTVTQEGGAVTAPTIRFESRTNDVAADGGVVMVQPGSRMTGRRLLANLGTKRADMRGDVVLVRAPGPPPRPSDRVVTALAKEETTITAERIVFLWAVNDAEAEDQVVVKQRDKTAWGDRMTYSERLNRLVLTGRVILEQLSGQWLVREGLVSLPRDPKEREALGAVTKLTCSKLTMTLRERDIVTEGPLTVTQRNRSAVGDRGTYTDATKILVITGNVHMREADGQRLRADRVVISLVDETFDADGNVQTEFLIRPSPAPVAGPSPTATAVPRP